MASDLCQRLACALEEVIWSATAEQLIASEAVLRSYLAAADCNLAAVLAELSDEGLALAVKKNVFRKPAFEEWLVHRYERSLLRWFFRRTGNWDRAQDLTQQLYLKLLTPAVLEKYNPECLFRPWLWAIAHNLWADEMRRSSQLVHVVDLEQRDGGPDPVEEAASRELAQRIEVALQSLPEVKQRILRGAMAGQTADDLARDLRLPKQRIFQFLFRARRQVERALGLESGGPAGRKEAVGNPRVPLERML
jgi:RNA polymerase sigma factor (sigma-70 family)